MPEMPRTAEELAHWLLANEPGAHGSHEELTMAAVRLYQQLHDHLAVFLGQQGINALWARAVHLARRSFPWDATGTHEAGAVQHTLSAAVHGRDLAEAHAVLVAIFTHFFTMLFSFIGADLGFHLLQQRWTTVGISMGGEPNQEQAQ